MSHRRQPQEAATLSDIQRELRTVSQACTLLSRFVEQFHFHEAVATEDELTAQSVTHVQGRRKTFHLLDDKAYHILCVHEQEMRKIRLRALLKYRETKSSSTNTPEQHRFIADGNMAAHAGLALLDASIFSTPEGRDLPHLFERHEDICTEIYSIKPDEILDRWSDGDYLRVLNCLGGLALMTGLNDEDKAGIVDLIAEYKLIPGRETVGTLSGGDRDRMKDLLVKIQKRHQQLWEMSNARRFKSNPARNSGHRLSQKADKFNNSPISTAHRRIQSSSAAAYQAPRGSTTSFGPRNSSSTSDDWRARAGEPDVRASQTIDPTASTPTPAEEGCSNQSGSTKGSKKSLKERVKDKTKQLGQRMKNSGK